MDTAVGVGACGEGEACSRVDGVLARVPKVTLATRVILEIGVDGVVYPALEGDAQTTRYTFGGVPAGARVCEDKASDAAGLGPYVVRGMRNTGNECFIHAVSQLLLSAPEFRSLLEEVRATQSGQISHARTPVLFALLGALDACGGDAETRRVFPVTEGVRARAVRGSAPVGGDPYAGLSKTARRRAKKRAAKAAAAAAAAGPPRGVAVGAAWQPYGLYELVGEFVAQSGASLTGRRGLGEQHDAQEWLLYVLDTLHEELVGMGSEAVVADEGGWEEVGSGKRTRTVQHTVSTVSAVRALFGGELRSSVRGTQSKESVTITPFVCLPLEVSDPSVRSLADALELTMTHEYVDDWNDSRLDTQVQISKQLSLETLPPLLLVHLQRFAFDYDGDVHKVTRRIRFPHEWRIPERMFAVPQTERHVYDLAGVVSHHGRHLWGGHYTACVQVDGVWLSVDDAQVDPGCVDGASSGDAYLLLFRRRQSL